MAGYLGNNPSDSSVRIARQIYTTSGVTTDFTFTSGYDPGYIDVYVNGERQTEGTNFTANDGSTVIILNGGVSTGSTVECAAYKTFNVATVTLGEVTDVDDLVITGKITAGSGDIGIATIHSSGIDAGVGVITAASYVGDGSALTGLASTDIINAEQVNVSGSTTTGIATVSTSIVVGSAVTVTATAININPTVTTTIGDSGNVDFNDDAKARFGTGNDLSIYHSGAHSFINDSGTGNLKILSSQVDILNPASNETIATFAENGAVSLYYDNSVKLATTNDGTVTTGIGTFTTNVAIDAAFGEANTDANDLVIGSSSDTNKGISIIGSTSAGIGQIIFTDGAGYKNQGYIQYRHADDSMRFKTNPAEAFRIDSSQRLLVGHTANLHDYKLQVMGDDGNASLALSRFTNNSASSLLEFNKSRNGSIGSNTVVQDDDTVGVIRFKGADGTDYAQVADIQAQVDGTPGDNDMPGRLIFGTTADGAQYTSERMRITNAGKVLIGTTTEGDGAADNLTIADSGNSGITIRSGASNNGAIFFADGTAGNSNYEGTIQYDHSNNELYFRSAALIALTLDSSQNATFGGTVSDSKGNLRTIIKNTKASAYVAVASDAGKCIFISSGGVTINNSVFSDGDAVTIVNNSTSDQTITQGSGVTMHNTADASSGNRTLAGRGMATIWFHEAAECYISGAGLS